MILFTKPFLPPENEYRQYIEGIWQRNWLTNNGPLVNELELKLKEYLQVPHLLYLNKSKKVIKFAFFREKKKKRQSILSWIISNFEYNKQNFLIIKTFIFFF